MSGVIMTGNYPCQQAAHRPAARLAAVQGAHGLNDDADESILHNLSCSADNP